MSMNIFIIAKRPVELVRKDGSRATEIQSETFAALQTPTRVTYAIVESVDPKQAYIDWVLSECSRDEQFPVYASDDRFGEREPVGYETYNAGKEHIELFNGWVQSVEDRGFVVEFEVI